MPSWYFAGPERRMGPGPISPAGAADVNSETTAWVGAVVTAGGTVGSTQRGYVDTLITSLKGHGLWTKLSRMHLLASESSFQALIDIVNLGTATVANAPAFTVSQGYTGNGSNARIDTNFSNDAVYTLNSAHHGGYSRTTRAGDVSVLYGVNYSINPDSFVQPKHTDTNSYLEVNGQTFPGASSPGTNGHWIGNRIDAGNIELYRNNASVVAASSSISGSVDTTTFSLLALHKYDGTYNSHTSDQLAVWHAGGTLTHAEQTNMFADVNAYMTSLGTNVY